MHKFVKNDDPLESTIPEFKSRDHEMTQNHDPRQTWKWSSSNGFGRPFFNKKKKSAVSGDSAAICSTRHHIAKKNRTRTLEIWSRPLH